MWARPLWRRCRKGRAQKQTQAPASWHACRWLSGSSAGNTVSRSYCRMVWRRRSVRGTSRGGAPSWPASRSSLCFVYRRGCCLCLEFASAAATFVPEDLPRRVWYCARCCNGPPCRSRPGWRSLRAGHAVFGAVFRRVQRRALVVVQRRNAAGGCGGLAPCKGESLRGGYPSHVAGPEERFLFRIIPSYTKRGGRTDQ